MHFFVVLLAGLSNLVKMGGGDKSWVERGKSRRVSFGAGCDASSKSRLLSLSLFLKAKFHVFLLDFGLILYRYPYFVLVRNRRKCFFGHHFKRNIQVLSISFV